MFGTNGFEYPGEYLEGMSLTYSNATTADCSLESMREAMRELCSLMPPKSEMLVGVRMNARMIGAMEKEATSAQRPIYSLRITQQDDLLFGEYVQEMADGSEKFNSPFGPWRKPTGLKQPAGT